MLYAREISKAAHFVERPNAIGVCKGADDTYVITAEYSDGYMVLGSYRRLAGATAALPKIRLKLEESTQ